LTPTSQVAWRIGAGHIVIAIRLTPRADRDGIDGIVTLSDGRRVVAARVRAVPDKGAANQALAALIAKSLDVPKSAVAVVAGNTARLKQVRIDGDTQELTRKLGALLSAA
jgi:uncharacterized protein (TIGR00251 family)